MTAAVRAFAPDDLAGLTDLLNLHLAAATPGFTVPARWLQSRIAPHDRRETRVAVVGRRVVAAARLAPALPGADESAEIEWLLAEPGAAGAGAELLADAIERLAPHGEPIHACRSPLALGAAPGVANSWRHVATLLEDAGFGDPAGHSALYAGLVPTGRAAPTPVAGMRVVREATDGGVSFVAMIEDAWIASFTVALADPGELPAFARWAQVRAMEVEPGHRRRGVGVRVVREAAGWLRLAGRDRLVVSVADDERRLGSYWRTFGLTWIARTTHGLRRG